MYPSRTIYRVPQVCRASRAAPSAARNMSFLAPTFFHRFGGPGFVNGQSEIGSLFRLLDDVASSPIFSNAFPGAATARPQAYTPRFDVREVENAYELRGELPGVEQKDLEIEFTDPQTLTIRGRSERESSTGAPEAQTTIAQATDATSATEKTDADDAASVHSSSSYHKPTVEDDFEDVERPATPGAATPATTIAEANTSQTPAVAAQATQYEASAQKQDTSRYWVSERSIGEFQRTFSFPSRVDHDGVKASLKNGILSVVVPKAEAPKARRINIE
ncbi:hypothetical protein MRB53_039888 [Persea americana]|nr:hypothetical protein MRB53_039888 [Persea americana]